MFIFDAHLDLSLNALEYNRDLRRTVAQIREQEAGKTDLKGRACGTVSFPEMRQAGIGICVATQIAGCMKPAGPVGAWESPEQAWAMTQGQLAWYRAMETAGELRPITNRDQLHQQIRDWKLDPEQTPIGYILSLEGADSIRDLSDLQDSFDQGLRALGPAHYGIGRYALGHDQDGPLSDLGKRLLSEMDRLGIIMDVTHLCEQTFWQALDCFGGSVWASHHNCRSIVDDPRQLTDNQIKAIAQRGGVIGAAFDVWMVVPNWIRGKTLPTDMPHADIAAVADHVDHICQLVGNANHIGIGTDLDGGYGTEQTPVGLDTIADLQKFVDALADRGYSNEDLAKITHQNFIEFLDRAWA